MLVADVHVKLPTRPVERRASSWERFRERLGSDVDLETGWERPAQGVGTIIEQLLHVLVTSDLTDLMVLWLDGEPVYIDRQHVEGELEDAFLVPMADGLLNDSLREIRFAVDHRDRDLHSVVEVVLRTPVPEGTDALRIHLTARIPELQVQPGESALNFHRRVRGFAQQDRRIQAYHVLHREMCSRLAEHLREVFDEVVVEAPRVELRRPDAPTMTTFRHLPFGADVTEPAYHPPGGHPARGSNTDPYGMFYPDPYHPLLHWILIDSMIRDGAWALPWVHLLSAVGNLITTGDQVATDLERLAWRHEAVSYDVDGVLLVNPTA